MGRGWLENSVGTDYNLTTKWVGENRYFTTEWHAKNPLALFSSPVAPLQNAHHQKRKNFQASWLQNGMHHPILKRLILTKINTYGGRKARRSVEVIGRGMKSSKKTWNTQRRSLPIHVCKSLKWDPSHQPSCDSIGNALIQGSNQRRQLLKRGVLLDELCKGVWYSSVSFWKGSPMWKGFNDNPISTSFQWEKRVRPRLVAWKNLSISHYLQCEQLVSLSSGNL